MLAEKYISINVNKVPVIGLITMSVAYKQGSSLGVERLGLETFFKR